MSIILTLIVISYLLYTLVSMYRVLSSTQNYNVKLQTKSQQILISGGTGFIGSKLVVAFLKDGHSVTVLTRNPDKLTVKQQHYSKLIAVKNLDNITTKFNIVINLAGETIAQRWSTSTKSKILNSRIKTTALLVKYLKNNNIKPDVFISGSAVGIYGTSATQTFTESSATTKNMFSANVCTKWESKALEATDISTRVVILRTGLVLARDGGVVAKMLFPHLLNLGAKISTGTQLMSWIDMQDLVGIFEFIINNEQVNGVINATAPNPTTNSEFSTELSKSLNRACFLTIPAFVLNIVLGKEMAQELLIEGQKVTPQRLLDLGYVFKYDTIQKSMINFLKQI